MFRNAILATAAALALATISTSSNAAPPRNWQKHLWQLHQQSFRTTTATQNSRMNAALNPCGYGWGMGADGQCHMH